MNKDHKNVRDLLSYPTPKFNITTLDYSLYKYTNGTKKLSDFNIAADITRMIKNQNLF